MIFEIEKKSDDVNNKKKYYLPKCVQKTVVRNDVRAIRKIDQIASLSVHLSNTSLKAHLNIFGIDHRIIPAFQLKRDRRLIRSRKNIFAGNFFQRRRYDISARRRNGSQILKIFCKIYSDICV